MQKKNTTKILDPTTNVLLLVDAAVKRLDDLHAVEIKHINDQLTMYADYTKQLACAESNRIDAIRAVDVGAVVVASERAEASWGCTFVLKQATAPSSSGAVIFSQKAEQRQTLIMCHRRLRLISRRIRWL